MGSADKERWKACIQPTVTEDAFRIRKSYLRIRPVRHHKEDRVLALILVCFLSFVLWRTLGEECKRVGLGDEPRSVLSEFTQIRLAAIVLLTDAGKEIRTRYVRLSSDHQKFLLERLGLRLSS